MKAAKTTILTALGSVLVVTLSTSTSASALVVSGDPPAPRALGDVPLVVFGNYQNGDGNQAGDNNSQYSKSTANLKGDGNSLSQASPGSGLASNGNTSSPPSVSQQASQQNYQDASLDGGRGREQMNNQDAFQGLSGEQVGSFFDQQVNQLNHQIGGGGSGRQKNSQQAQQTVRLPEQPAPQPQSVDQQVAQQNEQEGGQGGLQVNDQSAQQNVQGDRRPGPERVNQQVKQTNKQVGGREKHSSSSKHKAKHHRQQVNKQAAQQNLEGTGATDAYQQVAQTNEQSGGPGQQTNEQLAQQNVDGASGPVNQHAAQNNEQQAAPGGQQSNEQTVQQKANGPQSVNQQAAQTNSQWGAGGGRQQNNQQVVQQSAGARRAESFSPTRFKVVRR